MIKESSYLFTSERLGFRNWTREDVPKMAAISADEDVMEFFPERATYDQTKSFVLRMQDMFELRGYCYFAVDLLESNEFIGFIGLCYQEYESAFTPCTDIGWRLDKKQWGHGYATEGAKRCLLWGFEQVKLELIIATAPCTNLRSIAVMSKIGMKWKLNFIHPRMVDIPHLRDFVCYEYTKPKNNSLFVST